ncbi:MAG: hypothetical protein EOM34_15985 [Clostridia bacterium]|nr:hypothetical protein [Clostridia bacterium]
MITDRYYYNRLTKKEQRIYTLLYKGILAHKQRVSLNGVVSVSSLCKILGAITNDNPQMYYLDQRQIATETSIAGTIAKLNYFFSASECVGYNREIEKAVNSIISNLKLEKIADEYEREKLIHDALARQVDYDHEAISTSNTRHIAIAHSIVGVFIDKKAVCEGIAKAMKLLLNTVNINCIVVTGQAKLEPDGGHAWNITRINGNAYHLDATWDIANSTHSSICYDYFNLSDNAISKDHSDYLNVPACASNADSYFAQTGTCFENENSVLKYAKQQFGENKTQLYIQWDGSAESTKKIAENLVQTGLTTLSSDGYNWRATYSVNAEQQTIRIQYSIRV